jgi:hypothetical protein
MRLTRTPGEGSSHAGLVGRVEGDGDGGGCVADFAAAAAEDALAGDGPVFVFVAEVGC